MKMCSKREVLQLLKNVQRYKKLGIYNFKRDRKLVITVYNDEKYTVGENGYTTHTFQIKGSGELSKTINHLMEKEFPNSNRLYISPSKR